jgi:hypothetical protein
MHFQVQVMVSPAPAVKMVHVFYLLLETSISKSDSQEWVLVRSWKYDSDCTYKSFMYSDWWSKLK